MTLLRMRRCYVALVLGLSLCGHTSAAQFSFAAFGDMPYNAAEEPQLLHMIAEMNRQPLAFIVHVGDFKSSQQECSDELYLQRRESFEISRHPFVFIPGDNEWLDCRRAFWARRDPLERLAKLRELFFAHGTSLGQKRMAVERQSKRGFPEHLRWTVENVVFATLNVPGPNNNAAMPKEAGPRTAALLEWMREAFTVASRRNSPAVVLALQANLWSGASGYAEILSALAEQARNYAGEVLVVHGDTHLYKFDQPLTDPSSGKRIPNVTRLEVFGSPFLDWVRVTVHIQDGRARFTARRGDEVMR